VEGCDVNMSMYERRDFKKTCAGKNVVPHEMYQLPKLKPVKFYIEEELEWLIKNTKPGASDEILRRKGS
jgi:hypothetical protein